MTFRLEITLGNEAMQTGADVAAALTDIAEKVGMLDELETLDPYDTSGKIRDINGNTVGTWSVV